MITFQGARGRELGKALKTIFICFAVLPAQEKNCAPRFERPQIIEVARKFGAGEGIRTLAPNLGNGFGSLSPHFAFLRCNTKNYYTSIAYIGNRPAEPTLEKPAISVLLLPPCFPGHAATAWGSKSYLQRAPPLRQGPEINDQFY
jgi:hypothetical protein